MDSQNRKYDPAGVACVVVTLLGWSSVLLFLRHLAPYIDGWSANGWRYGMCAGGLCPYLLIRQCRGHADWHLWRRAIVPSVFNCIGQTFFGFAVYYIEPGLAAFLLRVSLVSSTLGAFTLFADERVLARSLLFWSGLSLIVIGSICTVAFSIHPVAGSSGFGMLLAAAAGGFFGLYGVSVRYFMRGVRPTDSFSAIATVTALVMIGLMFWRSPTRGACVLDLSAMNTFWIVLSAVIGIAIGHIFYYAAIARLGVAVAAAIVQLSPFFCSLGSIYLFGEVLTPGQWIAGAGMVFGASLLIRSEQRRGREAAPEGLAACPIELEADVPARTIRVAKDI
ncbi:MAG: DMT family transporter [Phycisphaerae bacterium]|nr:DMT family transporter [Phycisphaerae bacterium]